MNITPISINDIEEFLILMDDIVDIVKHPKVFMTTKAISGMLKHRGIAFIVQMKSFWMHIC